MTTSKVHCPVCDGDEWQEAGSAFAPDANRWYALSQCSRCGLRACLDWAIATPEYEPTYYAQTGTPGTSLRLWVKLVLEAAPGKLSSRLADGLLTVRVPQATRLGARLLDVGCGNGELLARATVLGWSAEGCEVDDAACAAARARGFTCYSGDWWRQLPEESYDLVVMSHVLEHLPHPRPALEAVTQALAPDGCVIIGMPNFAAAQAEAFGGVSWILMPPEHIWHLEPRHLDRLLAECGLVVLGWRTQPLLLDVFALRRVRAQRDVCRKAGAANGFWTTYLRATVRGLRERRAVPLRLATIYSYSCRRG